MVLRALFTLFLLASWFLPVAAEAAPPEYETVGGYFFGEASGQEGTGYATNGFLTGLAGSIAGLNYAKWSGDRTSSSATNQVSSDEQSASSRGLSSTPTLLVQGPKGQAQPVVGVPSYSSLESTIKSVS